MNISLMYLCAWSASKLIFYFFFRGEKSANSNKKLIKGYTIDIVTKDNRNQRFIIKSEQYILYLNLVSVVFQKDVLNFYIFPKKYREYSPVNTDGWLIYNPQREYKRQGINLDDDVCIA